MEKAIEPQAAHQPSARALALIVDRFPVSIAVLQGPDLVYELANQAYRGFVGHDDVVGRANRELQHQFITRMIERVYTTGEPFVDHELSLVLDRDGDGRLSKGVFDTFVQPLRDSSGSVAGVSVFALEITGFVEARIHAQVRHAEATRENAMRDDFIAIASHELRNPLMAILGWTRVLRAQAQSSPQNARALERIELNAVAQSRLIDNLLDVSRIANGKLALEPRELDFGQLVQSVLDSTRPAVEAKGLRLEVVREPVLPRTFADDLRLQQVVWNLITNAIKFTPQGGVIIVTVRCLEAAIELTVADNGMGIPSELLHQVFERYKQADVSASSASRGLGLGLWIARDIVELHGGTICAYSEGAGRGATFVVRLPAAQANEASAVLAAELAPSEPLADAAVNQVAVLHQSFLPTADDRDGVVE